MYKLWGEMSKHSKSAEGQVWSDGKPGSLRWRRQRRARARKAGQGAAGPAGLTSGLGPWGTSVCFLSLYTVAFSANPPIKTRLSHHLSFDLALMEALYGPDAELRALWWVVPLVSPTPSEAVPSSCPLQSRRDGLGEGQEQNQSGLSMEARVLRPPP